MSGTTASRFSANIWSLTTSQIVYRIATIVVFGYIGRELGLGVLGQYGIIMGVLNLYLAFSDLGVSNFVIKEVSQNRTLGELYLDNFFVLQIIVGIAIIGLVILTGSLSSYSAIIMWGLAIGSIGLVFNGMANAYKALLSAHELLFPFAVIEVICVVVFIAGNTAVIIAGEGVLALISVTVLVFMTKYVAGVLWSRRYNVHVKLRVDPATMRTMLWLGLPFLLFNSAHFAIQRIDVLIVGAQGSEEIAGVYFAASRLVYSSLFVISVIGAALYPVFSRLLKENKEKVGPLYYQASTYLYVIACTVTLGFILFAPYFMELLLGKHVASFITILQIIAWYIPVFALGLLPSNILMVGDKVWSAAKVSVMGVIVMIITAILLYPIAGASGVAITVVAVEFILTLLYIIIAARNFSLGVIKTQAIQTSLILFAASGLYFVIPVEYEILRIAAPLLLFTILIFITGIIKGRDIRIIFELLLKRTSAL
jgi:O-antigen/teichoic acid export membrane protein